MSVAPAPRRSKGAAAGATAAATFINRRARPLLALLLGALAIVTILLANRKPLWNDELFTFYISGLPTPSDIWSVLETGVEQTPFFFYIVTQASMQLFGDGLLAVRLPEVLGSVLMGACLFAFVARRSAPVYGFVAVLFVFATIAHGYAYEARAYSLVLGFCAAALLCWQLVTEGGPHRRLAAVGLALSLAAAVGSHYYAVLVLIPLIAGEAARMLVRRRVDWLVFGAFGGALIPLLVFAPLIRESGEYSTNFWAEPSWSAAVRFFPDALLDRALPVVIGLILASAAFAAVRSSRRPGHASRAQRRPPTHELVALLTFLLLPLFGVALGLLVTDAFTDRSVLPALLGLAILIALTAWWADRDAPFAAISLLVALLVFAGARTAERFDEAAADADHQAQALSFLERHATPGDPIVIASPHDFFELSHRAARESERAFLYLADTRLAVKHLDTDAVELGMVGLEDIAPLNVEPYRPYLASHPRFRVYARDGAWDWLSTELRSNGAATRVLARDPRNGAVLAEVRPG